MPAPESSDIIRQPFAEAVERTATDDVVSISEAVTRSRLGQETCSWKGCVEEDFAKRG